MARYPACHGCCTAAAPPHLLQQLTSLPSHPPLPAIRRLCTPRLRLLRPHRRTLVQGRLGGRAARAGAHALCWRGAYCACEWLPSWVLQSAMLWLGAGKCRRARRLGGVGATCMQASSPHSTPPSPSTPIPAGLQRPDCRLRPRPAVRAGHGAGTRHAARRHPCKRRHAVGEMPVLVGKWMPAACNGSSPHCLVPMQHAPPPLFCLHPARSSRTHPTIPSPPLLCSCWRVCARRACARWRASRQRPPLCLPPWRPPAL